MAGPWPLIPGVRAAGHVTGGGFWHPGDSEGCVKCEPPKHRAARAFVISSSDVERCPRRSLAPAHYREDGTCRCPTEKG